MTSETDALADELIAARDEFIAVLDGIEPARLNASDLVGDWSARELVAHLGYWGGYAADAIHAVEEGRTHEFELELGDQEVDARNETVARVARHADLATARRREASSFEALVERLRAVDPALLGTRFAEWGALRDEIRGDGAVHYRKHAEELRDRVARS
jgi:hypothetical protein